MTQPTVLIGGAGIAGTALAFWLNKIGYRVTIVEIADGIRPGGQTVDLRGAGGEVVERMGLIDKIRARSFDQRGVAWIKSDGHRRAEMPVTAFDGNGLVSKLEILRGDLVDVLYQETKDQTEYRFDTRITELIQSDDAVEATLTDGTKLSVGLVVGCDGPHSTVRRLVFGPEEQFVQPRRLAMRRAAVGGGESRRLLFRRVRTRTHADRLTGPGDARRRRGILRLAAERHGHQPRARRRICVGWRVGTGSVMRPYIDRCQDLPNGIDGYLPKSDTDIAVTAQVMKWMQRWPFRSLAEKKWFTTADAIELPDY
jgi:2-polyprenyl-6-methoxyphenol hydroxylase-like FAD-dependent oxidoreductase